MSDEVFEIEDRKPGEFYIIQILHYPPVGIVGLGDDNKLYVWNDMIKTFTLL